MTVVAMRRSAATGSKFMLCRAILDVELNWTKVRRLGAHHLQEFLVVAPTEGW
ncbi:MAG: hypothetical protein IPI21_18625 [Propionivibrio sp.]|nr:hypothetical protein [Propionivibrio sp.]